MHTIDIITTPTEMLDLVRQSASWINDPAEFVHWTDQEFKFQQPITRFVEGSHPEEVFLLRENGVPVAYAELHKNRFGWVIARVLVHPEFRNRGFARKIMQACIDQVFKTQFVVSLFCVLDNCPAFKLYQNLGFKALEKYPDQGLQRMSLISSSLTSTQQPLQTA
ncbi:GNAT family N-acetyltransferase [Limnobacter sp.]|uniref:GNAT family N-acetyltransferase n=1 Tax=Limnobacter sp. TaxID=2003368 RepID=UPI002FDF7478